MRTVAGGLAALAVTAAVVTVLALSGGGNASAGMPTPGG